MYHDCAAYAPLLLDWWPASFVLQPSSVLVFQISESRALSFLRLGVTTFLYAEWNDGAFYLPAV